MANLGSKVQFSGISQIEPEICLSQINEAMLSCRATCGACLPRSGEVRAVTPTQRSCCGCREPTQPASDQGPPPEAFDVRFVELRAVASSRNRRYRVGCGDCQRAGYCVGRPGRFVERRSRQGHRRRCFIVPFVDKRSGRNNRVHAQKDRDQAPAHDQGVQPGRRHDGQEQLRRIQS